MFQGFPEKGFLMSSIALLAHQDELPGSQGPCIDSHALLPTYDGSISLDLPSSGVLVGKPDLAWNFIEAETGILKVFLMRKSTMKNPIVYKLKKINRKEYIRSGLNNLMITATNARIPIRRSLTLGEVVRYFFLSSVEKPNLLDSSSVSSKSNVGTCFRSKKSSTIDKGTKRSNQPLVVPRHINTTEVTKNLKAKRVQLKCIRHHLLREVFTYFTPSPCQSLNTNTHSFKKSEKFYFKSSTCFL